MTIRSILTIRSITFAVPSTHGSILFLIYDYIYYDYILCLYAYAFSDKIQQVILLLVIRNYNLPSPKYKDIDADIFLFYISQNPFSL